MTKQCDAQALKCKGSASLWVASLIVCLAAQTAFGENTRTGLSMSIWVRPTSPECPQTLMACGDEGSRLSLVLEKQGEQPLLKLKIDSAKSHGAASRNKPLPLDLWTHVAGTYDGTTLTLYVNGKKASATRTKAEVPKPVLVAHAGEREPTMMYGGLETYGCALNSAQIMDLYRGYIPAANRIATRLSAKEIVEQMKAPAPIADARYDGFQGIWFELGQKEKYGDKYSGGLGTYTAKHVPIAIYSEKANKTFFVYGGCKNGERYLLNMASCYDHKTGELAKPTIVHDKGGVNDPHDNASLAISNDGHLWVFISGRGRNRPGFIYRSVKPYDTDKFEWVDAREITYPQPRWIDGFGFFHMFTKYTGVRELYWSTSPDGYTWSEDQKLAGMGGHYQNANLRDGHIITSAFNMHPKGNVDQRTNLYYVETPDFGKTWHTVDGTSLALPMTDPHCPALVRDYQAEGRLVYMKDSGFDENGHPVILIVTSSSHAAGPQGDPRKWEVVHWNGKQWLFDTITTSTHNYDMGSLYIEKDGTWRVIGPTEPGPQKLGTGGEMVVWTSTDKGKSWKKVRQITRGSRFNQTYARRPLNAHPDFYAFWADGNADTMSESHLYFTNKDGSSLCRMPYHMTAGKAAPERLR